jgi:hypothetical protein
MVFSVSTNFGFSIKEIFLFFLLFQFYSKKLSRAFNFSFPFHLFKINFKTWKIWNIILISLRYFYRPEIVHKKSSVKIKICALHTIQSSRVTFFPDNTFFILMT